jgi:small ligand-binding sensory domain FIST
MPNSAASSLVLSPYSEPTVVSAARDALQRVGGRASCAFVFCSADYREQLSDFLELVQLHAHAPIVAGCSCSGLIGTATEAEGATGFSLLLLHLPDTQIHAFQFSAADAQGFSEREISSKASGVRSAGAEAWVLLANPLVTPVEAWLDEWNAAFPSVPCLGGLASGGSRGDDVFLWADREIVEGAVAIGLVAACGRDARQPGLQARGAALANYRVEQNFVLSLGSLSHRGSPGNLQHLSVADKTLARGNLFVGLAMSNTLKSSKQGLSCGIFLALIQPTAYRPWRSPRVGQTHNPTPRRPLR